MADFTIHAAKTHLSRLIARAAAGEEIIILHGKTPVARLTAISREPTKRRFGAYRGEFDTVVDVLAKAAAAARPYLLGEQFTAADVVIGSGLRWGTMFKLLPERPEFAGYLARLSERPALKRATEKDTELQRVQEAA